MIGTKTQDPVASHNEGGYLDIARRTYAPMLSTKEFDLSHPRNRPGYFILSPTIDSTPSRGRDLGNYLSR